ncbi:diphthamide biosynthesis protein 3 [Neocloeon triangulifer]|uniref:diphthamide biosynthesis protein 3 n=1 Tax=Neocloeon triangulifer TaxID=2078957 RepID=UPI00286F2292|nr:diphthamide biosynthesis protein 3 [Neocloeon triangulifer]
MSVYYDEIEIEDFEYDEELEIYHYPCPCGDRFEVSKEDLQQGKTEATCPSCSLVVKIVYDEEKFKPSESENAAVKKCPPAKVTA